MKPPAISLLLWAIVGFCCCGAAWFGVRTLTQLWPGARWILVWLGALGALLGLTRLGDYLAALMRYRWERQRYRLNLAFDPVRRLRK